MTKEELNALAEKAWEIDQQTNPNPVNPHAFVYGFKVGYRNSAEELESLSKELAVTDELLKDRERLLDAIPQCPTHGKCIPHALEWIGNQVEVQENYNKLKEAFEELLSHGHNMWTIKQAKEESMAKWRAKAGLK